MQQVIMVVDFYSNNIWINILSKAPMEIDNKETFSIVDIQV